jgi:hypothetical protein
MMSAPIPLMLLMETAAFTTLLPGWIELVEGDLHVGLDARKGFVHEF